ncbi:hypothetical protein MSPP1_000932 [Malassezia sp. CBS 17886]|nr:hypothetical protein MSPP1_000932 [Malassezia sp. CBS 17886]
MAFGQSKSTGRRGRPPKHQSAVNRAWNASRDRSSDDDFGARPVAPAPSRTAQASAGLLDPLASGFPDPRGPRPAAGYTSPGSRGVLDADAPEPTVDALQAELHSLRARYAEGIDERVQQALQERDTIQAQFDRLKELRMTQSEKTLVEWKRASEARHRHTLESVALWKNRAEHAERRLREVERENPDGDVRGDGPASSEESARLTAQLVATQRELAEQTSAAATLRDQLDTHAKAPDARADEAAIRRLYEDLTGFIISDVEQHDGEREQRRYKIVFAGADSHDLLFSLEESQLHVSADEARRTDTAEIRDDLVYTPHLDEVRDARLLASDHMPDHFLEQIRFERSAATKFLTALHKGVKR